MRERIAGLCESLLLAIVHALLPAHGRHRAGPAQPLGGERPFAPAAATSARLDHPVDVGPFEQDTHLVRPYLLTHDERRERRLRRRRRQALWLAVHGIDVGPRRIHGVAVSA
ncbi:hypothetical protein OG895_17695 [Streptomyces sp. NBC_00201]|uniref:hypothetical protein n=1 Tax=unclassified Streptomyces TaxID=2593676 RepID=UPI00225B43D6|nr:MULTISPECIES: hypothetical protein [unclassified Streptomyces]MCX5049184.1 hypothetical protein [Streptomyces sp. NBC_00474]MCX5247042.1 hypothetical protein [Streptomyces sp. NBC_00201]MCX5287167.1 hypothetical protein [Streptomyces sp. NBC_00183]